MIAVVDYQKGNLLSVQRGLAAVGAQAIITSDPARIAAADAIVLPGVGAFADAAATMDELGQMNVIRARVQEGVYFLGICLGMHLMFEEGMEGSAAEKSAGGAYATGLGLLPGVVSALPRTDAQGNAYKIPHVGWNSVSFPQASSEGGLSSNGATYGCGATATQQENPLFAGIAQGEYFYFTHSYAAPDSQATIATTTHSITFPCAVQVGQRAFGVQFHPEKSSDAGLALLRNFVTFAQEVER